MFLALINPSFCVIGPIIDLNWAEFKTLESDSPSRVNRQKIGTEQESEIGTKFFFRPEMRKTDGFNFELLFFASIRGLGIASILVRKTSSDLG